MTLQALSPKAKIYLLTPLWGQAKEDKKGPKHTIRDLVVQQEIYPIIQHVSQKRCIEMIDLYHPFLQ